MDLVSCSRFTIFKENEMVQGRQMIFTVFLLPFLGGMLFAQDLDESLESFLVDSWDQPQSAFYADNQGNETQESIVWQVRGSKYTSESRPKMVYVPDEWPVSLFGIRPENPENPGIIGIRGAFNRQGYNEIEIIPGVGQGRDFEPKPIPLPGRVKKLDLWAWGSNQNMYIEIHFEDFKGASHVFSPVRTANRRDEGSLFFVGWQNMYIMMPNYISKAVNVKTSVPNLVLKKIVLVTNPMAQVRDFFVYLDHLRVLTDRRLSYYDGYGLASKRRVDEIWNTGE